LERLLLGGSRWKFVLPFALPSLKELPSLCAWRVPVSQETAE
jgi:hypothetical protein